MPISQQQRDQLRKAVVGYLATRSTLKFAAPAINRTLTYKGVLKFEIEENELDSALAYVEEKGYVKSVHEDMGTTVYWQTTDDGVLASERNGWDL